MKANQTTGPSAPCSAPLTAESMVPDVGNSIPPTAPPGKTDASTPSVNDHGPAPVLTTNVVEHWIDEINHALGSSTGWVIMAGRRLLAAKKELLHGQWMAIFASGKLKLGLRKAEVLMAIAKNPVFSKKEHFPKWPRAWTTLYALSKLPVEVLELGINSGVVNPGLKLAEAVRLLQRAAGPADPAKTAAPTFNLARQQAHLQRYLRRQGTRWPPDQHEKLAQLLETVAAELRDEEKHL